LPFACAQTPEGAAPPADKPIPGPDSTYRLSGKVATPRIKYAPDPVYPQIKKKVKGEVKLWLVVNEKGLTESIKVSDSLQPELDQAAIDAVSKWKFDPAKVNGKTVRVQISVVVRFNP
jgi:protein TonB